MKNLYIWFDSQESRRDFVLRLFEIRPNIPKKIMMRTADETKKRKEDMNHSLDMLDRGKYSSPYLHLKESFSQSAFEEEYLDSLDPWHPILLYTKGFRRVYTLRSYFFRHGYWLVVQLADNVEGQLRYDWIGKVIPATRLGLNVPITLYPCLASVVFIEKHINDWLTANSLPVNHLVMLDSLLKAKKLHPELFKGERIYLWEQLAKTYEARNDLDLAKTCYLAQAELNPSDSGPYLNLGAMYGKHQMVQQAIESYLDGLRINPNDEYIYHNLASLLAACGEHKWALKMLNHAILANPSRGINYRLKGDILHEAGHFEAAIACYEQALELFDDNWTTSAVNTYLRKARICRNLGNTEAAKADLECGLLLDGENLHILRHLAQLSMDTKEWESAQTYAKKLLAVNPGNTDAYYILSQCLRQLGSSEAAWYQKKWMQNN